MNREQDAGPTFLSRRSMLRGLALATGGAAALGLGVTNRAEADEKIPKKVVSYQDTPHGNQSCSNCLQFLPPSSCKVVEGKISPNGWCKVYVKKPQA